MSVIASLIDKIAGYRTIAVLFVLFVVFGVYIMPSFQKAISELAGKKVSIIDLQSGLHPEDIYDMIEDYGAEGRRLYRWVEMSADVIYPIIYTLFFSVILYFLYEKLGVVFPFGRLYFFPFLMMFADYVENVFIIFMLSLYPVKLMALAYLCSAASIVKWISLAINLLLILYGVVMLFVQKLVKR